MALLKLLIGCATLCLQHECLWQFIYQNSWNCHSIPEATKKMKRAQSFFKSLWGCFSFLFFPVLSSRDRSWCVKVQSHSFGWMTIISWWLSFKIYVGYLIYYLICLRYSLGKKKEQKQNQPFNLFYALPKCMSKMKQLFAEVFSEMLDHKWKGIW